MNQEKIGKFIQELRKEKGLTQVELAEKLGVSNRTVSKWENGNNLPDYSMFNILCEELNISINELLSGEKLTKENFRGAFEEVADFYYSWMSDTADDEDLKKILDINDEQLFLMRVAKEDKLDDYLKLKKILEESNGDIYFISYEPYNDDYYDKYIEKNEVLMRGGL